MKTNLNIFHWMLSLLFLGVIFILVGCSSGGSTGPAQSTLNEAWEQFESGDYSEAIETFRTAITENSTLTDGYNGLGWSHAFSGVLDSASLHLSTAISKDASLIEPLACLSAVNLANGEYADAISHATDALDLDNNWSFDHYSGIDYLDLHLILAEAYFRQGETSFPDAQDQVDILDPSNGLDPSDSQTWNGYPSYSVALLVIIQSLEEQIGADMLL